MFSSTNSSSKWALALCTAIVSLIIVLTYWPVAHAQFVYTDIIDFQKMAWLRHGDRWMPLLFRGFNNWTIYFRPLGVALFTLQVRLFDAQPGPMHLVSLALHLVNTLLVGTFALQIGKHDPVQKHRLGVLCISTLLYGLHPLLVEPVVWIGCQFELTATLFMLLGWIANIDMARPGLRALIVAICFFLAAASKESAAAFPFVIVTLDWFIRTGPNNSSISARIRKLLTHNWLTYAAIVLTGLAYLTIRHGALGVLVPAVDTHPLPLWARLQESAFLYLRYWRMFFWPTMGMGPLHPIPSQQFLHFNASTALQDTGAACILIMGILLTLRRRHFGGLILGVTFSLLPVLHLIGPNFDASLYHERYAMTALALACAWLPTSLQQMSVPPSVHRLLPLAGKLILSAWLILAVITIRVTAPLWSTQINLWTWAVQNDPTSINARDELISAYMEQGDDASAWKLIDEIVKNHEQCVTCMLNAATLSIGEGNPQRASFFLQKVKDLPELNSRSNFRTYLTLIAQIEVLQDHYKQAEAVARTAIALDNLDPQPQLVLAVALAMQGQITAAVQVEDAATPLLTKDKQVKERQKFEALKDYLRTHPAANQTLRAPSSVVPHPQSTGNHSGGHEG
ncbi:tetratricopeptide repeat protein [Dyella nitratireducens]|nr:hypothetical protein [Dyella nitratireducens]